MTDNTRQPSVQRDLVIVRTEDGVTTLTMNNPKRLNGWTGDMMEAIESALEKAASDNQTSVVVLTGTDPYYCAGVNLSATLRMEHPKKMHANIIEHNQALFDTYLDFPKPILVAVNGPAIGASVTSATLCDGIIASEKATFSTPFAALGITPEGCSSIHFSRLMGDENAARMLGTEGWKPTAKEACEAGLIQWVVPHEQLADEAGKIAREWVNSGVKRSFRGGSEREELKSINAAESIQLATAFLSTPFLRAQFRFLKSRKKWGPAMMFLAMLITRPLWSRTLSH